MAFSYSLALKNLLPAALHASASTAGGGGLAGVRCGGGAGAESLSVALGEASDCGGGGLEGVGERIVFCSSAMACELALCLDRRDSLRSSSGGKFSGWLSGSCFAAADDLFRLVADRDEAAATLRPLESSFVGL